MREDIKESLFTLPIPLPPALHSASDSFFFFAHFTSLHFTLIFLCDLYNIYLHSAFMERKLHIFELASNAFILLLFKIKAFGRLFQSLTALGSKLNLYILVLA